MQKIVLAFAAILTVLPTLAWSLPETNTNTTASVSVPVENQDTEFITVGKKEKGIKLFVETGGGTMVSGGLVWRINPIFGVGFSVGYTDPPFKNFGVSLAVRAETIPLWLDLDVVKINLLIGFNGIYFLGSGTQYMGAIIGGEVVIRPFQYLVPSVNLYLYQVGESMIPQLSFQLRYSF